jgi:hypothetical protein
MMLFRPTSFVLVEMFPLTLPLPGVASAPSETEEENSLTSQREKRAAEPSLSSAAVLFGKAALPSINKYLLSSLLVLILPLLLL